jgi:hypothetical protein
VYQHYTLLPILRLRACVDICARIPSDTWQRSSVSLLFLCLLSFFWCTGCWLLFHGFGMRHSRSPTALTRTQMRRVSNRVCRDSRSLPHYADPLPPTPLPSSSTSGGRGRERTTAATSWDSALENTVPHSPRRVSVSLTFLLFSKRSILITGNPTGAVKSYSYYYSLKREKAEQLKKGG